MFHVPFDPFSRMEYPFQHYIISNESNFLAIIAITMLSMESVYLLC
jgi:hypothetical protein